MTGTPNDEIITLTTGNDELKCVKSILVKHSDYFKAMFTGNFTEKDKSVIKLKDIDLKALNIILHYLKDTERNIIDDDDLLVVIHVACVLQFVDIIEKCVTRLTEILCPDNCINIWFVSEMLSLKPLWFKAKYLALTEFHVVKNQDCLTQLELEQFHKYLSNVYLVCDELDVIFTCLNWIYANEKSVDEYLIPLLSCVDFSRLNIREIEDIKLLDDIRDSETIKSLLNNIIEYKHNLSSEYSNTVKTLMSGRPRQSFDLDLMIFCQVLPNYENIENGLPKKVKFNSNDISAGLLVYDPTLNAFHNCLDISDDKWHEGFHVIGYKEFIFLFGGEVSFGNGIWNFNFWVYDTFRKRWERKTKLPVGRRHFSSCICGNYLFIVGGISSFRIPVDNLYWYNYKENIWSTPIHLPCEGYQVKICNFNDKLFMLNFQNRYGFFFNNTTAKFSGPIPIVDKKQLIQTIPTTFSLFSYNNKIYVKGSALIELEVHPTEIHVISYKSLEPLNCDSLQAILCGDVVYTLYKNNINEQQISIEKFSMLTMETSTIISASRGDVIEINGRNVWVTDSMRIFSMQDFKRMSNSDIYINELPAIQECKYD